MFAQGCSFNVIVDTLNSVNYSCIPKYNREQTTLLCQCHTTPPTRAYNKKRVNLSVTAFYNLTLWVLTIVITIAIVEVWYETQKGVAMEAVAQKEKTANVILRLTPAQKQEIKAFAESKNMTISGLIRWLLYQTMKEDKKNND